MSNINKELKEVAQVLEKYNSTLKECDNLEKLSIDIKENQELQKELKRKRLLIRRIDNGMTILSDDERIVLEMLCIKGYSLEVVMARLHKAECTIREIKKRALMRIRKYVM